MNFQIVKAGHEPRIVPQFLILAVLAGITACVETAIGAVDALLIEGVDEIEVTTQDNTVVVVKRVQA